MKAPLKINETKKLFYNKFVYKINLELGGVAYLKRMSFEDLKKMQSFGSSFGRHSTTRDQAIKNKKEIIELGFFLEACKSKYTFHSRAEGSTLSLYSNDENFVNKIKKECKDYTTELWEPASVQAESFLKSNTRKIICDALPKGKYRYKVHIANASIPTNSRVSFLNWANKYDDSRIFLPCSTKRNLGEESAGYFYGQYFYTSDDKMLNMSLMFFSDYIQKTEHYVLKTELS